MVENKFTLQDYFFAACSLQRCLKVEQRRDTASGTTFHRFSRIRERHVEMLMVESVICKIAMNFAVSLSS